MAVLCATAASLPAAPIDAETARRIDASSTPAPGELALAEVRKATERFRDVDVALAEGYIAEPTHTCDMADLMGHR
ncbi:hypothetical protein, partial [Roseovarius sp.]|uniref:hypothetical protein n=1 Tax=Roseovarius sp. TaxID=1486281 RepID=UPI0035165BB0